MTKTATAIATTTTRPTLPKSDPKTAALLAELYDAIGCGVIYPPVLDQNGNVVDGANRIAYAEKRGIRYQVIPVVVSEEQRDLLKVALNLTTRSPSQQETRDLVRWLLKRWHHLSNRQIAGVVGVDHKTVQRVRDKEEARGALPHQSHRQDSNGRKQPARKPTKITPVWRAGYTRLRAIAETLGEDLPQGETTPRKVRRCLGAKERARYAKGAPETTPIGIKVVHGDFRQVTTKPFAHLAICDPDWSQPWKRHRKDYAGKVASLLLPGGFAACLCPSPGILEWGEVYQQAGLTYRWAVDFVYSDRPVLRNDGTILAAKLSVLIFQKGGRWRTPKVMSDVFHDQDPRSNSHHDWQQSVGGIKYLIEHLTHAKSVVVDLTLGSGTTAVATLLAGQGRSFLGTEIDKTNCAIARRRVLEATHAKTEGQTG